MAEQEKNESFYRKVVRFVVNPATHWSDLGARQEETKELEHEKSELKAMIERKRRNDFVRKREFDMLRKVRREGLSPEQLSALGSSSRLDDAESRSSEAALPRADSVKAKIDEIEQQMVVEGGLSGGFSRRGGFDSSSRYTAFPPPGSSTDTHLPPVSAPVPVATVGLDTLPMHFSGHSAPPPGNPSTHFSSPASAEVSEVLHDPDLDEAVIAFANADFGPCEEALQALIGPGGARARHAETWLALFDLYRATGQEQRFESLALDYARQFGLSAPQWYSLPKLVAGRLAEEPVVRRPDGAGSPIGGDVGWVCPELLDIEAVTRLRSQTLQLPLPWVFDWGSLRSIDAEAAMQLSTIFRLWAGQQLEMRWLDGDRLFQVLAETAPTGVRDADPAFWLTRLDALRLANRADQFDEAAIDYCITYEVSPPSWEPTRCAVHISGSAMSTRNPPMSLASEVSTSFHESGPADAAAGSVEVAHVELSGQLIGDISATLTRLQGQIGLAPVVSVSCAQLIRVDFIAAGDLLNWVLARRGESRTVQFVEAHRLVALFFGAMGISEHAKVKVHRV
jgi:hypothetical protein